MDPSQEGLLAKANKQESKRTGSLDDDGSAIASDLDATEWLDHGTPDTSDVSFSKPRATTLTNNRRSRLRRPRSKCCTMALIILGLALLFLLAGAGVLFKKYKDEPPYGQSPPWYPTPRGGTAKSWAESYRKAGDMVSRMTLPEKVNVTTGTGWMMGLAVGTNGPAVHVGFPQLQLQDGPLGIRFADNSTAFPAGITVGATWNKKLMYERGKAHGNEARGKGIHALLGPCVGPLGRMPAGGRNWEGFGADPYLQGIAGAETIRGIQSEGVMATIKHFVGNEQEHFRQPWEWALPHAMSSNIDDRTLHELYSWPFGDAVRAGVASVMCSYNMVNNSYACSNSKLLNGVLKDELGFQGFVVSDWLAQRAGVASALSGLDMTMPGDGLRWANGESLWGSELTRSVLNGSVSLERLNDMVTRIVAAWYQMGQDDQDAFDNSGPNFSSWTDDAEAVLAPGSPSQQEKETVNKFINVQANHSKIARQVAAEGIVLLKNEKCLPLARDGSTVSRRHHLVGREDGKQRKIGIFGEDAGPGNGPNACDDRGCNQGTLASGWGSGAVEFPHLITPVASLKNAFEGSKVDLTIHLDNAVRTDVFRDQDLCIVFANSDAGEGYIKWNDVSGDRNDLLLQKGGEALVESVAEHCGGETIVVIHAVGPVIMERWIDKPGVRAVLWANLPGEESGNALADVLFGDINPSGHLPYTLGKSLDDYGPGAQIMYRPNGVVPQQDFEEGLFVDYRHFDAQGIEPRFEFGFGLSYTTFSYGNLTVDEVKPKTEMPSPRPKPGNSPPTYDDRIPDKKEALWPAGLRRLEKYIYPYLDKEDDLGTNTAAAAGYPYPEGYGTIQHPSDAGGDEGGNPDLWEIYVRVTVEARNTGDKDGQAVPQLYLSYPSSKKVMAKGIQFPIKVLRGFEKIDLKPGEMQRVEFGLTRRDLSYWDVERQNWVMLVEGSYVLHVGASSRDLPVQGSW